MINIVWQRNPEDANRTYVELKLACYSGSALSGCYANRTYVELKLRSDSGCALGWCMLIVLM